MNATVKTQIIPNDIRIQIAKAAQNYIQPAKVCWQTAKSKEI